MQMQLTALETRVLGVLMEKATTTPDQYPLSLNGLTTGCNQKTNRDPVLELSETEVQATLDSLIKKLLVSEVRFGSRIAKYQHRFANSEFSEYKFSPQEQALICVLFLRGAQTPGELRTRTNRLCSFDDVEQTEAVLKGLVAKGGGPYVASLARQPGRRESRYVHLFSGEPDLAALADNDTSAQVTSAATPAAAEPSQELLDRIELLEAMVEELQARITALES